MDTVCGARRSLPSRRAGSVATRQGGKNEKKEWAVGRVWVDSARGVLGGIPYRPGEKTLRAFLTGTRIS